MGDRDDFRRYPLNIARNEVDADDLRLYSQELERRSPSLFVQASPQCSVGMWNQEHARDGQANGPSQKWLPVSSLSTLQDLQSSWKGGFDRGESSILVINRKNSWSRMKILPDMFKFICSSIEIHPRFLDFAFGLGRKTAPVDETFIGFSKTLSFSANGKPSSYDVCYNLRYFERHGRQLSDPWSHRQSAIHQKFYFARGQSAWTIIHQPLMFRETLQDADSKSGSHPMALHVRYIRSATHYYREYLVSKSSELFVMDAKVSIPKPYNEFEVDFRTIQNIQSIRKKLHIVMPILDGILEVLANLIAHAEVVGEVMNQPLSARTTLRVELDLILTEMKSHRSTAQCLLRVSEDLRLMNQNVLAFYNQEVSVKNGVSLAQLAQLGATDNRALTVMTEKTQKDSRTMRITTVIAMVYLPANLVVSFFSTGLVNFYSSEQSSTTASGVKMKVHSQVWIAIVTSMALAIFTLAAVAIWDRLGRK